MLMTIMLTVDDDDDVDDNDDSDDNDGDNDNNDDDDNIESHTSMRLVDAKDYEVYYLTIIQWARVVYEMVNN